MEPLVIHSEPAQLRVAAVYADAPAERLLFAQYRLWMAGYSAGDADYWDRAFGILLRFAKPESAKILHREFHLFTRTLNERTRKEIIWRFSACRCLCQDEFFGVETDRRVSTKGPKCGKPRRYGAFGKWRCRVNIDGKPVARQSAPIKSFHFCADRARTGQRKHAASST
jgi:hypothetical protein